MEKVHWLQKKEKTDLRRTWGDGNVLKLDCGLHNFIY